MTDAHAKAVEAAARAARELAIPHTNKVEPWDGASATERDVWLGHSADAITAYLTAMRAAGWVFVRDVGERKMTSGDGIVATIHRAYDAGWNACRAAMLKGAGDEQG